MGGLLSGVLSRGIPLCRRSTRVSVHPLVLYWQAVFHLLHYSDVLGGPGRNDWLALAAFPMPWFYILSGFSLCVVYGGGRTNVDKYVSPRAGDLPAPAIGLRRTLLDRRSATYATNASPPRPLRHHSYQTMPMLVRAFAQVGFPSQPLCASDAPPLAHLVVRPRVVLDGPQFACTPLG